jgi:hypothetical protein
VRDDQDRDVPSPIQLSQEIDDRRLTGDIHSYGGFIEHEHIGVCGECSGEQHALLLPRRQVPKQLLAEGVDVEQRQGSIRRVALRAPNALKSGGFCTWTHQHDLEHGDRNDSLDPLALRNVADAQARTPLHASSERLEKSEHRPQQRGLATSVGSHYPQNLSSRNLERQVPEERVVPISERQVLAL